MAISKILRLRNNTVLDEFRDKAADRTEWQCLVEKLEETTGEVDDSDKSTTRYGSRGLKVTNTIIKEIPADKPLIGHYLQEMTTA